MTFSIDGRPVGPEYPPYVIAELSGNHNGDIGRAKELIRIAKQAGADAVKLQTYTADTITIDHDSPEFTISGGPWKGRRLYELYQEAHTPWDWHRALFDAARKEGISILSTPFDFTAVEFLEELQAPIYKIASFECIDLPLIRKAASTGKPLIISTGMATMTEVSEAVEAAKDAGSPEVVLLHCISAYPSQPKDYNLSTIPEMARRFGVSVGLSDHTLGHLVATSAVALGATVIEKHVTLRRADGGPDAAFSLEPDELAEMVAQVRAAHASLGTPRAGVTEVEKGSMVFRRSLYVVRDVGKGELLTADHVRSIRPGYGLPPKHLDDVIGRTALTDLQRGTALQWDHVSGE